MVHPGIVLWRDALGLSQCPWRLYPCSYPEGPKSPTVSPPGSSRSTGWVSLWVPWRPGCCLPPDLPGSDAPAGTGTGTSVLWALALTPCPGGWATWSLYPLLLARPGSRQDKLWQTDHPARGGAAHRPPGLPGWGHPTLGISASNGPVEPRLPGHCGWRPGFPSPPLGHPADCQPHLLPSATLGSPEAQWATCGVGTCLSSLIPQGSHRLMSSLLSAG